MDSFFKYIKKYCFKFYTAFIFFKADWKLYFMWKNSQLYIHWWTLIAYIKLHKNYYWYCIQSSPWYDWLTVLWELLLVIWSTYVGLTYGRKYIYTEITVILLVLNIIFFILNTLITKKIYINTFFWNKLLIWFKLNTKEKQEKVNKYISEKWAILSWGRDLYIYIFYNILLWVYVYNLLWNLYHFIYP